jgi:hypothetical protein
MFQNRSHSSRKVWARIAIGALLLLAVKPAAPANYRIFLKGGKIVEAKAKPVSMEGTLHFTAADGSFGTLPTSLVDLEQTQKMNPVGSAKQSAGKVLTNEDLLLKRDESSGQSVSAQGKTVQRPGQEKSPAKSTIASKEQKRGETYWRNQAKQIRDQITAVESEIRTLDENAKSGKADGIQIGYGTTTQYLLVNFEDQRKKLEKDKQDLESRMRALEEEARQEGAMPGWLR